MAKPEDPELAAAELVLPLVKTWDALRSLGFEPDATAMSDPPGALVLDFGNFRLQAIHCMSPRFAQIVMLSGVLRTPRTLAEVHCEMPQALESREQCAAWVTWCLDDHADGEFKPARATPWLAEGRALRRLLPWERRLAVIRKRQAEYLARPQCVALRKWARPAVRTLQGWIEKASMAAVVTFAFDGEVLTIRFGDEMIAVPAKGDAWPTRYAIPSNALRQLPDRFMKEQVHFGVFRGVLTIDRIGYPGAVAERRVAPCDCRADDPSVAHATLRKCEGLDRLVDRSHYTVDILRCRACGQLYAYVWVERVEFAKEDDSDCTVYLPITEDGARQLREAGDRVGTTELARAYTGTRYLMDSYLPPRLPTVAWYEGSLLIPLMWY